MKTRVEYKIGEPQPGEEDPGFGAFDFEDAPDVRQFGAAAAIAKAAKHMADDRLLSSKLNTARSVEFIVLRLS